VADWIEANLVHGPGDLRGQPAKLDDEKRGLLVRFYEVYPQDHPSAGRRRFKRCGLSVRKGWAKTEFAAMIAAAELHSTAPVRCIGWDSRGNPIGGGVTDPYIPLVAYTEEQSDELAYSALKVMLEEGPLADDFDIGLMRIMRKGGDGKAVSLAASPDARDGARTTFQVADETHRWVLPRLRQAHKTMLANLPKRKLADAWALETTTSYSPGEGSIAESTMDYARAIADGKTAAEPRFFFFHRQAKDVPPDQGGYDLTKADDIRAAAIEAAGPYVAAWSDTDAIVEQFNAPDADRPYLCRVWFNWITAGSDRAFDSVKWATLAAPRSILPGETIVLGFDGSRNHDSTAIVATHVQSGYQWLVKAWERPFGPSGEGWEVPRGEVTQTIADCFERWSVWKLYADPPGWEETVASWAGRYGSDRIKEWFTYKHRPMAMALISYAGAMAAEELSHDGDPTFAVHIGNSCKRKLTIVDDKGEKLWAAVKERPDSPHKIDAAIAGCLSWEARNDAVTEGVGLDERSVYEDRGLILI
jgi:hypothetical protein